MTREEINKVVSASQGALSLAHAMGNFGIQAKSLEKAANLIVEMSKPLPDDLLDYKRAESWSEEMFAFNVPLVRKTLLELFERIGHGKNTAEQAEGQRIVAAPDSL